MSHITLDMVDDCASALYSQLAPNKSQMETFQSLSPRQAERYRSIARAALIMASATSFTDIASRERLDRIAEAIYLQHDPGTSDTSPFVMRPNGSKDRYRGYAQLVLGRSGL